VQSWIITYKIGVDKSDQILLYYSFQRKSVKWWKKLFSHLFDLALVNAHILHQKRCTKKFRLHKFIEKMSERVVPNRGREVTEQSWISSASRLVGRDHSAHRVPATSSKLKGCSQHTCKVCVDKGKHNTIKSTKKYTTIYCRKCDIGFCLGECFEVYHTKVNYWD
jgi:maltodextrin utilization protein YvdJ